MSQVNKHFRCILGYFKTDPHMALSAEVIDFVRSHSLEYAVQG